MSRTVIGWLAVLLVVTGGTGIWLGVKYASAINRAGSRAEIDLNYLQRPADASQEILKSFTLTSESSKALASKDLAGQVYVTNFFFSNCPGTCLQQNQAIGTIAREYGPRGVRFLSITCDPDNDHPDRLREYGTKLNADPRHWSFLTGEMVYLLRVAGEIYLIPLEKQTHSERFFVTDKWGNIRGNFAWNKLDQITQMKLLLDKLLAETEPPAEAESLPAIKQPAASSTSAGAPAAGQPEEN